MRARTLILLCCILFASFGFAAQGVAGDEVVRKAPFDAGKICSVSQDLYYKGRYETCLHDPGPLHNDRDPIDPVTYNLNYAAVSARNGTLAVGGFDTFYYQVGVHPYPIIGPTYVYNVRRSAAIVRFDAPSAGTLTMSASITYTSATSPNVRKFRACLEAFDVTPFRGPFPFTGHVLLGSKCFYEDQSGTFVKTVDVIDAQPIEIEAALDNTLDNGAGAGVVSEIRYTFTPSA